MKKIIPSFIVLGTSLICLASCNIKKASNSSNNITNSTTTSNITTNPNIPASSANTTNSNNSTSKPTSSPSSSTSKPTSNPSSSTSNTSIPSSSSTNIEYNLDLTKITTASDTAKLTTETLNNSFLTVINSNYVTARYNTKKNENYCR